MVLKCLVCQQTFKKGASRSFHRLPRDPSRRQKWLAVLGEVKPDERICSDHFAESDFELKSGGVRYLKKDAIPVIASSSRMCLEREAGVDNTHTATDLSATISVSLSATITASDPSATITASDLSATITASDLSTTITASEDSERSFEVKNTSITATASESETGGNEKAEKISGQLPTKTSRKRSYPRYAGDDVSSSKGSPRKMRRGLEIAKKTIYRQRMKIKALQKSKLRLKSRLLSLNAVINFLKEKYALTDSAHNLLQASVGGVGHHIFSRMLTGSARAKYSKELRTFALTLSFYSTKAYNYVRESFNRNLPHISTISKWYQSVDGSPGFTQDAFRALRARVEDEAKKGQKVLCSLVLDEMAVMQRVEWTGKKFTGFVDLGTNIESDSVPEAKEVLVFMLVAVNGRWKIPVAYFLIDGLNGSEKANLVNKLLELLHDTGIIVTSITFDGAPSNIRMSSILGADFSNLNALKMYFLHPTTKEKIFLFLDPCHMLKLVRNCLASQKTLIDGEGGSITWSFFEALSELQYQEGLKAGTKVTRRHIQWFREKMKVKLAAQTFSNSVADAFLYLSEDLQLSQFKEVGATVKFTRIINNLFDIFNVQTKFSKSNFRKALSLETADEMFRYLTFCKDYISQLTLKGQLVVKSGRKTGFIGFIIDINSLEGLFKQFIIETPLLKYVLTYKLSQDHLEIFFSIVRSKGGFSNNPTARQFEHIYKRMLVHSELKGSVHGNVTAIDETSILYCSSRVTRNDVGEDLLESVEYEKLCNELDSLDFLHSTAWHLTSYCSDIVAYIAGFVVKCLKKCISCEACLCVLEAEEPLSKLQIWKQYGVLQNASSFVIEVCRAAEMCFRVFLIKGYLLRTEHNVIELLRLQTLRNLSPSIFESFGDHVLDLDHENYHPTQVISLIVKRYASIRIHHETKKLKDSTQNRVRSVLTKTILFQHQ